jgi:hypothetical protein
MAIINDGPNEWKGLGTYFKHGMSDMKLPDVHGGQGFNYAARTIEGSGTGAIGVIALYSPTDHKTIHILFSVPWSTVFFSNWWNVQVYDGKKKANNYFYNSLYLTPVKADGNRHTRDLDYGYSCSGVMIASDKATLEVRIKRKYNVVK